MNPYSLDLRKRVVGAVKQGQNQSQVARRFAVWSSTVSRYMVSRYMAYSEPRDSLAPKPPPGAGRKIPEAVSVALSERVAQAPGATLAQHQAWLAQTHGIAVSPATVHRAVHRLGFTHKKRASSPAKGTSRSANSGTKRSRAWTGFRATRGSVKASSACSRFRGWRRMQ